MKQELLGNVYGENFSTGYAGNVYDKNYLSPTIRTCQGGGNQPMVVVNVTNNPTNTCRNTEDQKQ